MKLIHNNFRYMQYLSPLVATMAIANCGMYITWSSPSLPKFKSGIDSPIDRKLTPEELSWVASGIMFGLMVGGVFAGIIIEKIGRKWSILLGSIPLFIPWLVIAFTKSVSLLIAFRIIAGLGGALVMTTIPLYTAEITDKDIRGKLGASFNLLKLTGSLYVLCVGPFVSYKTLTLSCSVLPFVFIVLFYFMPESPYYLIKIGKKEQAYKNLERLCSNNTSKEAIQIRLNDIQETVDHDMRNKSSIWEFVSKPEYRKSMIVMFGIKTLQQFSGMNAIDPYLQTIVESSKSSISPEISSIVCGFVQIPAVLLSASLVDKLGRKPLLIVSAMGCGLALVAEGTYFYLAEVTDTDVSSISWLPTTALIVYLIMNPIGVFTLPYILLGEMFATNIKESACAFLSFYGATTGFIVIKVFGPISAAWGMYTMFYIFAAFCFAGSIFVFLFAPETKGKTFMEIQKKLNRADTKL